MANGLRQQIGSPAFFRPELMPSGRSMGEVDREGGRISGFGLPEPEVQSQPPSSPEIDPEGLSDYFDDSGFDQPGLEGPRKAWADKWRRELTRLQSKDQSLAEYIRFGENIGGNWSPEEFANFKGYRQSLMMRHLPRRAKQELDTIRQRKTEHQKLLALIRQKKMMQEAFPDKEMGRGGQLTNKKLTYQQKLGMRGKAEIDAARKQLEINPNLVVYRSGGSLSQPQLTMIDPSNKNQAELAADKGWTIYPKSLVMGEETPDEPDQSGDIDAYINSAAGPTVPVLFKGVVYQVPKAQAAEAFQRGGSVPGGQ